MKKLFYALFSTFVVLLSSCSTSVVEIAASGKPYDIFVVAPKTIWNNAPGDTLRTVMSEEVLWVNQPEPIFSLYNITPEAFNRNVRIHRNLMILNVNSAIDSVQFEVRKDVWVNGQVVVDITAANNEMLAQYIAQNGQTIVDYLTIVEQNRFKERAAKYSDSKIEQLIKQKFNFSMKIPTGYRVALDTTNFLWITNEMPIASQGVMIYTFDKPSEGEKIDILAQRNAAVMRVPGPVAGSYMSSDSTFMPESNVVDLNGQAWVETRGFWNVQGDFMGGPFMNFATFDRANNRYVAIDMYVNSPSPKYPKRNYIRQLESFMLNVELLK